MDAILSRLLMSRRQVSSAAAFAGCDHLLVAPRNLRKQSSRACCCATHARRAAPTRKRRHLPTMRFADSILALRTWTCLLYTSPSPRDAHES
eukprot:3969744-Prymnesium_polylepis.1